MVQGILESAIGIWKSYRGEKMVDRAGDKWWDRVIPTVDSESGAEQGEDRSGEVHKLWVVGAERSGNEIGGAWG
jgi:hypothetical protein